MMVMTTSTTPTPTRRHVRATSASDADGRRALAQNDTHTYRHSVVVSQHTKQHTIVYAADIYAIPTLVLHHLCLHIEPAPARERCGCPMCFPQPTDGRGRMVWRWLRRAELDCYVCVYPALYYLSYTTVPCMRLKLCSRSLAVCTRARVRIDCSIWTLYVLRRFCVSLAAGRVSVCASSSSGGGVYKCVSTSEPCAACGMPRRS